MRWIRKGYSFLKLILSKIPVVHEVPMRKLKITRGEIERIKDEAFREGKKLGYKCGVKNTVSDLQSHLNTLKEDNEAL